VTIDRNQKTYEVQVGDMRSKHQQQMEQFNEELESVRKVSEDNVLEIQRKTCVGGPSA